MPIATSLILAVIFLVGTFFITAVTVAFRRLQRQAPKATLDELGRLFFYRNVQSSIIGRDEVDLILVGLVCAQNITRFCYAVFSVFTVAYAEILPWEIVSRNDFDLRWLWLILSLLAFAGVSLLLSDFLPRTWAGRNPKSALRSCGPVASVFLTIFLPISYLFIKLNLGLSDRSVEEPSEEAMAEVKDKIMEIIEDSGKSEQLDPHDQKIIESAIHFQYRFVREIMVPRVDMFTLSAEASIRDAAKMLADEGYSRTPVYRDNVDNVVGLLMYHDLLEIYMKADETGDRSLLEGPVASVIREVIYTPETKKISDLLQEFRAKQMHLAIVVDEYGGTEGIVTIEDILEEIVGEIADEYDTEEKLFTVQADGAWVVDARMSILDIEDHLGIRIPQDGDYDTIGGYVFHKAGSIPATGLVIHNDDFELEILSSTDRRIEKIKITPLVEPGDEGTHV